MAVVIDDFEVVAETQQAPGDGAPPTPSTPPPSPGLTPEDVRQVVSLLEERCARLFAH